MSKFTIFLLLSFSISFSTTWHVKASGDNANDGKTIETPFLTFSKLRDSLRAGDTAKIDSSINVSDTTLFDGASGTWAAPTCSTRVYILGCDASGIINDTGELTALNVTSAILFIIKLTTSSNYYSIIGIELNGNDLATNCLTHNNSDVAGIQIINSSGHDATSHNFNIRTMYTFDTGWFLRRVDSYSSGGSGFSVNSSSVRANISYDRCKAWGNASNGFESSGTQYYPSFDGCWAYLNGGDGISCTGAPALSVRNCVSAWNTGDGIDIGSGSRNLNQLKIFNNILWRNSGYEINFRGNKLNGINYAVADYNCVDTTGTECDINSGVVPGEFNLYSDPMLVDTVAPVLDLNVKIGSPCINRGY